jgi:hypothetical protein
LRGCGAWQHGADRGFRVEGGDIAFGVGKTVELAECIVVPLADFARAVGVANQLAVGVVGQLFAVTVGICDDYGQVVAVVAVLGGALQWVDGFDDVAALIVVVLP